MNTFKNVIRFLLLDMCHRICEPQLSYMYVNSVVLLQFVQMMQTHLCCASSTNNFLGDGSKLAPVSSGFFSEHLLCVLYPYRIKSLA